MLGRGVFLAKKTNKKPLNKTFITSPRHRVGTHLQPNQKLYEKTYVLSETFRKEKKQRAHIVQGSCPGVSKNLLSDDLRHSSVESSLLVVFRPVYGVGGVVDRRLLVYDPSPDHIFQDRPMLLLEYIPQLSPLGPRRKYLLSLLAFADVIYRAADERLLHLFGVGIEVVTGHQ